MHRGPTIYQIAKEAGVSPSTAARILSGRSQGSERTRERVLEAARQLGYQLNLVAQSLSTGSSRGVGVLTPDIGDPFFMEVLRGVERGLFGSGYYPLIADGHWQLGENRQALDLLLGHRVSALVVAAKHRPPERVARLAEELPLVLIGQRVEGLEGRCLAIDNVAASAGVTRHLVGLGHRRIAYLGGPPLHWHTGDRFRGYGLALEEAGLDLVPELVRAGNFDERSGYLAVDGLVKQGVPFTAVYASNDLMAYGARLALHDHGLEVPRDVSLAGFDDLPGSQYTVPPLTTWRQPAYAMGMDAARGLLARLAGEAYEPEAYAGELVVRGTTAPPR